MKEVEVQKKDGTLRLKLGRYELKLPSTAANQKTLIIFARLFREEGTGKNCFTYQKISQGLGNPNRQWSCNFFREFEAAGRDLLRFLKKELKLQEAYLEPVHQQILQNPFLSVAKHHKIFLQKHPNCPLPEETFREYARLIDGSKLLQQVRRMVNPQTLEFDHKFYLQEILQNFSLSSADRAEITTLFPEVQEGDPTQSSLCEEPPQTVGDRELAPTPLLQKAKLSSFLYASGLSMEVLALLFSVCKGTIHNWVYQFSNAQLEESILQSICCWSGQVSADEKWVKINGVWWFVFCAVDAVTGFPLLLRLYPTADALSWQLFFLQFKALYGVPNLLISDGSQSLAAGKKRVFPKVVHQLCKFHKLRNLFRRLFKHIKERPLLSRCLRLAKQLFSNRYVSSRKYAARTLAKIAPDPVREYVENNILGYWKQLSRSLTSNAAERFNRKLEKGFSGRYGLKSEKSARVLLRALWYKECVMRGQKHLDSCEEFSPQQLAQICKEHILLPENLHFLDKKEAIMPQKTV